MKDQLHIKIPWLLVAALLFIKGVQAQGEQQIFFIILVGLFTMPAGLVVIAVGSLLIGLNTSVTPGLAVNNSWAVDAVIYFLSLLFGYIQWFVLFPKFKKKLMSHNLYVRVATIAATVILLFGIYQFFTRGFGRGW